MMDTRVHIKLKHTACSISSPPGRSTAAPGSTG
jgi:hypothetical protein